MHLMTLTLKGFQKVEVEHLKYNERMFFGMMASGTSFVTNYSLTLGKSL